MTRLMTRLMVPLLALVMVGAGCSASRKSQRLEGNYEVASPGSGWKSVSPGGADNAWLNEGLSASIYTDSNCGVRYEDTDLSKLAERLMLGLEDPEEVSVQEFMLDGRSALTRRVRGGIDGVSVELAATVLKKGDCIYDLVIIAPPSNFEAAWSGFTAARDSFRTRN